MKIGTIWRMFKKTFILEGLLLLIAFFTWFVIGGRSVVSLSNILFVSGAIAIIIGNVVSFANARGEISRDYRISRFFNQDELLGQERKDMANRFSHLIHFFIAGAIAIILAIIIGQIKG